jgi:PiT family inorganic phosphate transporter/sodium-dependent phosphate transporter
MAYLHQYDYIFAIGLIFAFLDAWNIGANDVANSFATSVSSRSLTMKQAMCIATAMEFTGAMAVGARVADTIRTKVVDPSLFEEAPAVLMLMMTCAIIGSSVYLTVATKIGLPVSTTHSIMGGVIGAGIAAVGADSITWGWEGVAQVFAAWGIAPCLSGAFGAIIFLITEFGVLRRSNPIRNGLVSIPFYFFLTSSLLAMLIVWKGAKSSIDLTEDQVTGVIVGTGAVVATLVSIFFLPYIYRKTSCGDWELRLWHIPLGPLLLRRGPPPPKPQGATDGIQDYYRGHLTREELEAKRAQEAALKEKSEKPTGEKGATAESAESVDSDEITSSAQRTGETNILPPVITSTGKRPDGPWYSPPVAFYYFKYAIFRGVEKEVVEMQNKKNILSGDLEEAHAHVAHFDNKAEYMFSFLQVMTAATASFAHGANDISNAVGPFATIYLVWSTGMTSEETPVPTWILAFGGASLVLGLWTYGYNIMRNLGNRLTLHSPSRGFCMELGSATTVIMATQLELPISTTQCITGATVGVGLCSGTWRSINWRMVAWIYFGWFITLPVTGIIAGCLMGIILNAPNWGNRA